MEKKSKKKKIINYSLVIYYSSSIIRWFIHLFKMESLIPKFAKSSEFAKDWVAKYVFACPQQQIIASHSFMLLI